MAHLELNWVDEIDEDWEATLKVATFMDPRHKSFKLKRLTLRQQKKYLDSAAALARGVYEAHFMADAESQPETAEKSSAEITHPAKKQKMDPHMRRDYTVDTSELLDRDSDVSLTLTLTLTLASNPNPFCSTRMANQILKTMIAVSSSGRGMWISLR